MNIGAEHSVAPFYELANYELANVHRTIFKIAPF
tara:strand:+ start:2275 stop:2376 length:102 start_codon:yes stop_codon:yes gene_type:complete